MNAMSVDYLCCMKIKTDRQGGDTRKKRVPRDYPTLRLLPAKLQSSDRILMATSLFRV